MLFKLALAFIYAAAAAVADDPGATTSAAQAPPEWAVASTMQLTLTLHSSKPSAQLPVVPSTTHIGLNQSSNALQVCIVSDAPSRPLHLPWHSPSLHILIIVGYLCVGKHGRDQP